MPEFTPALFALSQQCSSVSYNLLDPLRHRSAPHLYPGNPQDPNLKHTSAYVLEMAQCGIELHRLFQAQTFHLLEAAMDPLTWDEQARLRGIAQGERLKPALSLSAKVNTRGTLEVYWRPYQSPGTENNRYFLKRESVWSRIGAGDTVLRVLAREYLGPEFPPPNADSDRVRASKQFLTDTFRLCLDSFLRTAGTVCDVHVGSWPKLDDSGRPVLTSLDDRMRCQAAANAQTATTRLTECATAVVGKLQVLGLDSLDRYRDLEVKAQATGLKISRVLFDETGHRSTSLQHDSVATLITALESAGYAHLQAQGALGEAWQR
jgi:hypothetical protein